MSQPSLDERLSSVAPGGSPRGIDLRQLFHTLLDRAWIILSVFVLVTLLTVVYLQRSPRIYAATATLQVEQQEQKILKFDRVVQDDLRSSETLRTILQTLKTRSLLERVAASTRLGENPRFVGPDGGNLTTNQVAGKLEGMITVRLRSGTRLIDVTVEHTDPEVTSLVGNALIRDFIRLGFDQDSAASDLATEHLQREAERLKPKLHESEMALQNYMADSKSVSLEDRQNIVVPKLKELSTKVNEGKYALIKQEADHQNFMDLGTNALALLSLSAVANDPTVFGLQINIAKLESDFATLKQRYRAEHPKYLQMETQLTELRSSLTDAVLRVQQFLETAYASAQASQKALEDALAEQEKAALELNKQAIQYSVLSREVQSDRAMYDAVLSRLKEMSLSKDLASYKVRIVESAVRPTYPIKPEKTKILTRGIFLGLLAGIGLAMAINSLDNTFKTVDQAEEILGQPVIATIPEIRNLAKASTQLVVEESARSGEAESFRNLRAALSMLGRTEDRRVFLFTSALPQEGKTFCSINFAISLCQQGLRTVVIDCDLRRPNVEKAIFGARKMHYGVTDYLTGQKTLDEVVNSGGHPNFFFIGAGSHAPNPSELLAQGRFARLIEEAATMFDRVIIDSAPIQAVSDTLLVLQGVQTICLTVRAGKTPRKAAMRALQTLQSSEVRVAGIILNCAKRRGGSYYYNYYDDSYHDEPEDKAGKQRNGKSKAAPKKEQERGSSLSV